MGFQRGLDAAIFAGPAVQRDKASVERQPIDRSQVLKRRID